MAEDNPTVNRWLPDPAMDNIDHALGRPIWPLKESHRNHFAVRVNDPRANEFKSPHWAKIGVERGGMIFFSVTDAGRKALDDYLKAYDQHKAFMVSFWGYDTIIPAKSRGQAKYALWLKVSDCYSELTFGEFVKQAKVRSA